jgi:hypothetical protein
MDIFPTFGAMRQIRLKKWQCMELVVHAIPIPPVREKACLLLFPAGKTL